MCATARDLVQTNQATVYEQVRRHCEMKLHVLAAPWWRSTWSHEYASTCDTSLPMVFLLIAGERCRTFAMLVMASKTDVSLFMSSV